MFDTVKRFFDIGLYSKEQVAAFVAKGKLTAEEYEEITGKKYGG